MLVDKMIICKSIRNQSNKENQRDKERNSKNNRNCRNSKKKSKGECKSNKSWINKTKININNKDQREQN